MDEEYIKNDIIPLAEKSHRILMKTPNAVNFLHSVTNDLEEIIPKLNKNVSNSAGDEAQYGLEKLNEVLKILYNKKKISKGECAFNNLANVLYSFGLDTHDH